MLYIVSISWYLSHEWQGRVSQRQLYKDMSEWLNVYLCVVHKDMSEWLNVYLCVVHKDMSEWLNVYLCGVHKDMLTTSNLQQVPGSSNTSIQASHCNEDLDDKQQYVTNESPNRYLNWIIAGKKHPHSANDHDNV